MSAERTPEADTAAKVRLEYAASRVDAFSLLTAAGATIGAGSDLERDDLAGPSVPGPFGLAWWGIVTAVNHMGMFVE